MKLEAGMYVRTKEGNIEKICAIENEHIYTDEDYLSWYPSSNAINKASHNIIDLIEVGDYVNGCYVSNKRASVNEHLGGHSKGIGIIKCNAYFNQGNYNKCKFEWFEEKDIKSIVTKEMFESMQYEVK